MTTTKQVDAQTITTVLAEEGSAVVSLSVVEHSSIVRGSFTLDLSKYPNMNAALPDLRKAIKDAIDEL
jgi:hypothetical protein